jgi:hypothetical protein
MTMSRTTRRIWPQHQTSIEENATMTAEQASASEMLRLIQAEYLEIPGLHLTKPQVQRLWGLDSYACDAMLDALVAVRFLRRNHRDAYVLVDSNR